LILLLHSEFRFGHYRFFGTRQRLRKSDFLGFS
jgi:hypothetical protein